MNDLESASKPAALSEELRHWSQWNGAFALLATAVSLALGTRGPALGLSCLSTIWVLARANTATLGLANTITAARLLGLVLILAVAPESGGLIGLATFAVYALDGLDGWIARRRGEASSFGAQFDMESDSHAMLLVSLHLVLVRGFGSWVLVCGLMRYLYVAARWAAGPVQVRERRSSWGRVVYSLVVVSLAIGCVPSWEPVATPLMAAATGLLLCSFAPDFAQLARGRAEGSAAIQEANAAQGCRPDKRMPCG